MKEYLKTLKRCLLVTAPILASCIVGNAPVKAATFAYSDSSLGFIEFSQNPLEVTTDTETRTIAENGMVQTMAEAEAFFLIEPAIALNSSLSTAFGENGTYLGLAESQASVIGEFEIEANTNFSFDFFSNLELVTSIDYPSSENARASGDISFALIDTNTEDILEFFSLTGNITTAGDNDFVALQKSDNVTLSDTFGAPGFGGLQEFLTVSIEGSLERSFTDDTTLALVEVKRNRAEVQGIPEPSFSLALLLSGGIISLVFKPQKLK